MYVRKSKRGAGVAQALLAHLEGVARGAGGHLRLETGVRQPAAMRLYETAACPHSCCAFPPYTTMAKAAIKNSMFYEKELT